MNKFLLLYRFAKYYNYKLKFVISIRKFFKLYFCFFIESKNQNSKNKNNFIGLETTHNCFNLDLFTWLNKDYEDLRSLFMNFVNDYQNIFKINFDINCF